MPNTYRCTQIVVILIIFSLASLLVTISHAESYSTQVIPCSAPPADLVAWWPADQNATDARGTNHGTPLNGVAYSSGKIGQAFQFDGALSAVRLPTGGPMSKAFQEFTVDAWVLPETHGSDTAYGSLYGRTVLSNTDTDGFALRVKNGYLQADLRTQQVSVLRTFDLNSAHALPLGKWSLVAMTYNGVELRIYLNGELVGSIPAQGAVGNTNNAGTCLMIGNEPIGCEVQRSGFGWHGLIDELEVLERALTQEEIRSLYLNGGRNSCENSECFQPPNLISWLPGEGNAIDIVGASTGKLENGASFTEGKVGQSFNFAKGSQAVTYPSTFLERPFAEFTLDAWLKPAANGNANDGNYGLTVVSNTDGDGLALRVWNGYIQADLRTATGDFLVTFNSGLQDQIPVGVWSHVAVVYDGGTVKAYLNGQSIGSHPVTGPIRNLGNSNTCAMLGNEPLGCAVQSGGFSFVGQIDELELLDRALNEDEILGLFTNGSTGRCKDLNSSPTPEDSPAGDWVVSFTLIDANNNTPVSGFDPISQGATINLRQLPSRNLSIRANTFPTTVGSVWFDLNAAYQHVENEGPYALFGDTGGSYSGGLGLGSHLLEGVPYSQKNLGGTRGSSLTLRFSVTDQSASSQTPTPTPTPTPAPTPTPTPNPTPLPTNTRRVTTTAELIEVLKGPGTPGETICLSGRFSRTASQLESSYWVFRSQLKGTASARITLTSCPGELAVIDGNIGSGQSQGRAVLWLDGQYTDIRGLEITNSAPSHPGPYKACEGPKAETGGIDTGATGGRFICQTGSSPWFMRGHGINDAGLNNRIINNLIHDTGNGVFSGASGQGSEIYGNIIYYNGWEAPDRGHGHGIYAQNSQNGPTKKIEGNIIHSMFGFGSQAYSGNGYIDNISFIGNVIFDGGFLQIKEGAGNPNLTINGAVTPAKNSIITDNFLFYTTAKGSQNINISGGSGVFERNLVVGGRFTTLVSDWTTSFSFTDNRLVNTVSDNYAFWLGEGALPFLAKYTWNRNDYYRAAGGPLPPFVISKSSNSESGDLNWWRKRTGFDASSTFQSSQLPSDRVTIVPNRYEAGRALIVIENWTKASLVAIDLTRAGLVAGQRFEIRDPKNYHGPAPVSLQAYDPSKPIVTINLTGLTNAAPVGMAAPVRIPSSINSFVIVPR